MIRVISWFRIINITVTVAIINIINIKNIVIRVGKERVNKML